MKIITTLFASFLIGTLAVAQTASDNANNMPNSSGTGYIYNFDGTASDNCTSTDVVITNEEEINGSVTNFQYSAGGTGYLEFNQTQNAPSDPNWWGNLLKFYDGDCAKMDLDLTNNATVEVKLNSDTACNLIIQYRDQSGVVTDGAGNYTFVPITKGDTTISSSNFTFAGNSGGDADSANIRAIKFAFKNGGAPTPGTFQIEYIKIGDQSGLNVTGVQEQLSANQDDGSDISVYPNPADNIINVNGVENAHISVSNVIGQKVASSQGSSVDVSALNEGLYIVSVYAGEALVRTERIVIE